MTSNPLRDIIKFPLYIIENGKIDFLIMERIKTKRNSKNIYYGEYFNKSHIFKIGLFYNKKLLRRYSIDKQLITQDKYINYEIIPRA